MSSLDAKPRLFRRGFCWGDSCNTNNGLAKNEGGVKFYEKMGLVPRNIVLEEDCNFLSMAE